MPRDDDVDDDDGNDDWLPLNECAYMEDESGSKRALSLSLSLSATRLNYINPTQVSQNKYVSLHGSFERFLGT